MNNKIHVLSSGIPLVDKTWGGFYIGGTYFLIGPHKSGKTILGIQCARECARQKQVCLYFTALKPKDLLIHSATIDFDMEAFINQNLIIVIKIALPSMSNISGKHDEELAVHWNEITRVIEQYKPDKIVFDDFTPFMGFHNYAALTEVFRRSMEVIEHYQTTNLFIFSDPANNISENLVNSVIKEGNGVIYINNENQSKEGEMTITPIVGHPEGQFKSFYSISAYEGITVDFIDSSPVMEVAKGKMIKGDKKGFGTGGNGRKNLFNDGFTLGNNDDDFNLDNDNTDDIET